MWTICIQCDKYSHWKQLKTSPFGFNTISAVTASSDLYQINQHYSQEYRNMKKSYFPAMLCILLSGCGGGGTGDTKNPASAATLTSISVAPTSPGIVQGETQQFTATGTYSDNSTGDVTAHATWTSSDTTKATITNAGLATGTGVGSSTIEATYNGKTNSTQLTVTALPSGTVRIAYLHHSTGGNIWGGGVPEYFTSYNSAHGTHYQITSITYPAAPASGYDSSTGYPWANYPYDYWNLWVNHTGTSQDRGELNLDQIAANYDVIVFKHCYPVSSIGPDSGPPSVSSSNQTIANYQLQYAALKTRMKQFPTKKFILWTGAAENSGSNSLENAQRAQTFFTWVKTTWDEHGDNIFIWDFFALETAGAAPYMNEANAMARPTPTPTPHSRPWSRPT
jgi:hypothetical protein